MDNLFNLMDRVKIELNQITGIVIGIAEFKRNTETVLVEYAETSGKVTSRWFDPDELEKV